MTTSTELGTRPVGRLLLKFSLPCVTGLLIGALYNIADQIFIGHSSLGYLGNAATGISFPIVCIANALAWCIGDGAAAYLSLCAGRRDSERAHRCVGTGIAATVLVGLLFSALCLIFCEPLMSLFGASEATLPIACSYFRILSAFFIPYLLLNVMNSMIRADGSPAFAMCAMLSGAVLNVVLDPICIFWLDWGIHGAAVATVIGQVLSCLLCIVYFRRPKTLRLSLRSFVPDISVLNRVLLLGSSTFVTQISLVVMTLVSNLLLFRYGALSVYGSDIPISVFSIQTKVYTIVGQIAVGIALGGQPILGYAYGAGRMDRVRETYRLIQTASMTVCIAATLLFVFCPQPIIRLFGEQSPLCMDFAVLSFRLFLGLSFVTAFIKNSSVFFQSIGRPVEATLASVLRDILCFPLLALLLCVVLEDHQPGNGICGILIASPLADIIAGSAVIALTVRFFRRPKRTIAPLPCPEQA